MPYVNIKITREGATPFVVIDEVELEGWGVGGLPVEVFRRPRTSPNT